MIIEPTRSLSCCPRIALLVIALLSQGCWPAQVPGYQYWQKDKNKRFHAVEAGRVITLLKVHVRETSSAFNEGGTILVEPCPGPNAPPARSALPCWPAEKHKRTQGFLAFLTTQRPDYRSEAAVMRAAQYFNRDLGAFSPAWIIGTSPLVVAYRQGTADPDPYTQERKAVERHPGVTIRPSTIPGVMELVGRSGQVSSYDLRSRKAQLVTDADLDIQADVVLIFPKQMRLSYRPFPNSSTTQTNPPLQVLYLPQPQPLREIMSALTKPGCLEQQAKQVVEAPVRPPF